MTPLLHVDKMTHYFGGLRAVHNYNLSVGPNQIVGAHSHFTGFKKVYLLVQKA
jgi:ABC-type phosphonate transport system ATPase subunit